MASMRVLELLAAERGLALCDLGPGAHISRISHGKVVPRPRTLVALARKLEIDPQRLEAMLEAERAAQGSTNG